MNASQSLLRQVRLQRGLVFGVIIVTALFAFEMFNYSTTEHALADLLGDSDFAGLRWATILTIAFCGIDFAGIARLFTPGANSDSSQSGPNESWYLFGAWLLAATMNAMLTWWGVSLAVLGHNTLGNEVVGRETLLRVVPVFVAVLVWLIRVLIIGTFSVAGDHLFNLDHVTVNTAVVSRVSNQPAVNPRLQPRIQNQTHQISNGAQTIANTRSAAYRNASGSVVKSGGRSGTTTVPLEMQSNNRPEPTYTSFSSSSASTGNRRPNAGRNVVGDPSGTHLSPRE